ncbi:hypothetical protein [Frigoriglobus tundricola]|uniref:Zinc-finger domain-containing protein n=1 Tax=Frigoriglobus tundricola TaxID=2774151 RepID=A0A6M5YS64_9BACT|nr:hypothetical protein [Frigoriglobus tundricola]QJW95822.1 hypothetical protein FTUN_3376 [Frigoriglobus tundricola]
MSDEDLIGYLFDLLDPGDRAAVAARVATDTETAARLEHLRAAVAPVLSAAEFERECPPEPRPGLALRTLAAVARHVVDSEPRVVEPSVVAAFLRDYPTEAAELDFDSGTRARVPQAAPAPPPAPARRWPRR